MKEVKAAQSSLTNKFQQSSLKLGNSPLNKTDDFQARVKTSARIQLKQQAVPPFPTTLAKLGKKKISYAERFKDEKENPVVSRFAKPTESMMRKK